MFPPAAAPIEGTEPVGGVASPQRLVAVDASDMIHEVHGFGHEESELQTHVVGFQPRRPANAPDAWETGALQRLAEGEPKVSSERTIGGARFLRTMRPLFVEESCLKCHAEQGYRPSMACPSASRDCWRSSANVKASRPTGSLAVCIGQSSTFAARKCCSMTLRQLCSRCRKGPDPAIVRNWTAASENGRKRQCRATAACFAQS